LLKNETKEARQTVDENILSWWQQKWEDEKEKGAWTKRLIPKIWDWVNRLHGETSYHLTQMLTGQNVYPLYPVAMLLTT